MDEIRVDKLLWLVRIFKSRSKATEACNAGKVMINHNLVKPSKTIKPEEVIEINLDKFIKKIRIRKIPNKRISAAILSNFIDDLTTQEKYDKLLTKNKVLFEIRHRGVGRPTKRDRRILDKFKDW